MLRGHDDDDASSGRFEQFGALFHPSVRAFDWPWDVNEIIWPCRHCAAWRAELFLEGPDDAIWIREWHAGDCKVWAEVEDLNG